MFFFIRFNIVKLCLKSPNERMKHMAINKPLQINTKETLSVDSEELNAHCVDVSTFIYTVYGQHPHVEKYEVCVSDSVFV